MLPASEVVLLDLPLLLEIQLHREPDRQVLAEASLRLDARLNAVERAPLPARGPLTHGFEELGLVEDFDDLVALALAFLSLVRSGAVLARYRRGAVSEGVHRVLLVESGPVRCVVICGCGRLPRVVSRLE